MRCFRSPVCFFRISSLDSAFLSTLTIFAVQKKGSLSNVVDDLENFTSEMEWSFFVPVVFSCVFSNWYSYASTPPAFPLA